MAEYIVKHERDMGYIPKGELIRCKDCKHWMNEHLCKKLSAYYGSINTDADFFCGYAERRSEC